MPGEPQMPAPNAGEAPNWQTVSSWFSHIYFGCCTCSAVILLVVHAFRWTELERSTWLRVGCRGRSRGRRLARLHGLAGVGELLVELAQGEVGDVHLGILESVHLTRPGELPAKRVEAAELCRLAVVERLRQLEPLLEEGGIE